MTSAVTYGSESVETSYTSIPPDVDIGPFRISPDGPQEAQNESLTWHHEAMRLCFNGLYPCPEVVRSVLAPAPGVRKRILDIGCGSRTWAVEMAQEFPDAEVWGWDRPHVRHLWTGDVPDNCHFRTAPDYNFLETYREQFDLIHMRFVAGGCTQFSKTMEDIQTCLRPGGLFILIDSTSDLLREDGRSLLQMRSSQQPDGIRLQRLLYEVHHANISVGFDENSMRSTLEEGMWGPDFSRLSECGAAEILVPIGPWFRSSDVDEERRLKTIGELMKKSINMVRSGHEILLKQLGFNERTLDAWGDEIKQEIENEDIKMLLDVRVLWGQRSPPSGTNPSRIPRLVLRRPPPNSQQPNPPSPGSQPSSTQRVHRYIRTCDNQAQWVKVTRNRQRPNVWAPDPMPFVMRRARNKASL